MRDRRGTRRRWCAGALTIALATAAHAAAAQPDRGMSRMNAEQMTRMMAGWPQASRTAAMAMTQKYGPPAAMTADMAMWGRTGPWKRTVVYKMEHAHEFPMHHTDVMQQWIDYRAPADLYDELATYDGSVVLERTAGEISARCDKEGANFLALNLADEIMRGKRSVADARTMYGDQITKMKAHQSATYTERLLFTPPMGGTGDPDRSVP